MATAVVEVARPRRAGKLELFLLVLRQRKLFAFGYLLITAIVVLALFAPLIVPYDPETADPAITLAAPSGSHWLGTDISGMDILSRVISSARIDLLIAVLGTLFSVLVGGPLGLIAGYFSGTRGLWGWVSEGMMRVADVLQAFPVFVLAIALVAALGQSARNVIIAIAFVNAPIYLRLLRTQALSLRERRFVDAARVAGNGELRIVFRHILPNAVAPAIIQASVNMGWAVLLTAGLSFVGAGVRVPTPEWGSMIAVGAQNMITGQWWPALFPGIAIAVTVLGFALIGDSLELMLDPVRRRQIVRERG
ncbi:MAG TPA: ABC transporter permease [Gaiellaceae bacterium]|nr:ABC transporter permease [Gaiellaceae bacterium]